MPGYFKLGRVFYIFDHKKTNMLELHFNNILFIIIFFNLIAVAGYSILYSRGKNVSNWLFSAFLISKALCFSTDFFWINFNYSHKHFINIFFAGLSFDLLLGPLILLYFRSLTNKNFSLKIIDSLHLIPFIVHAIYMSIIFHSKSIIEKNELITSGTLFNITYKTVNEYLIYISFITYIILLLNEVLRYHKKLENQFSDVEKLKLNWLIFLSLGLGLIWLYAVMSNLLGYWDVYIYLPISVYIILIFAFANIIYIFGSRYNYSFKGLDAGETKQKYKKTIIPDDRKDVLLKKIIEYIETEKPYLEPDININKLAEDLSIPSHQISQILNSRLNKNFFEFISYYRIKASMEELMKPDNKEKTILEILYEVGFNSKSAFNNAFKKHTGITPTQFKKQPQSISIPPIYN